MSARILQIVTLAAASLPLMNPAQQAEAAQLLNQLRAGRTANGETWQQKCAAAWQHDLQGVRSALAALLHTGGDQLDRSNAGAWQSFRRLLPGLLREANHAPKFADELARAMAAAIADPASIGRTANAIAADEEPGITAALQQWRAREVFETDLGSADLRTLSRELLNRSIFSARVTNADFLAEIGAAVDDILAGRTNMAQGRWRLLRKLKELGYDPAIGFPQDMALVPPAERGSLQDVSSEGRLDLILETNVRMASNYAQHLAGNTPYALHNYPAWEVVRLFQRNVPRGTPDSGSIGWPRRWADADQAVAGEGALERAMIARKDSPIWQALGDGAGGYDDTLGNPYPPFAFRSGMGWKPVNRTRAVELGVVSGDETPQRTEAQLAPGEKEVREAAGRLPEDLRAELLRELDTDTEQQTLARAQDAHEAKQREQAVERRRRAPQLQADHRAQMEAMTEGIA